MGGGDSTLICVKVVRSLFRACFNSIKVFFYANCEFSNILLYNDF